MMLTDDQEENKEQEKEECKEKVALVATSAAATIC